MAILSNVYYSIAVENRNKSISAKYEGKKHKVFLKVLCDSDNILEAIELAKQTSNIVMLEYRDIENSENYRSLTADTGVLIVNETELGNNFTEQELVEIIEDTPLGVTPVIRLQEDFTDLKAVCEYCKKYPRVRFIGGDLFRIPGARLGYFGSAILDKKNIKYSILSYRTAISENIISVVDWDKLECTISDKKESARTGSRKSSGSKSAKKPVSNRFQSLFTDGVMDF